MDSLGGVTGDSTVVNRMLTFFGGVSLGGIVGAISGYGLAALGVFDKPASSSPVRGPEDWMYLGTDALGMARTATENFTRELIGIVFCAALGCIAGLMFALFVMQRTMAKRK